MRNCVDSNEIKNLWEQGLCDVQIAQKLNISNITVAIHRRKLKLKANKSILGNKKREISKELLEELSSKYGTDSKIANVLGVTTVTVVSYRKKYGVHVENSKSNPAIPLSPTQKQVIFGSILGDAYCKKDEYDKNACLIFQHSLKQKEFADYKASFLSNFPSTIYAYDRNDIRTNKTYHVYTISFMTNPSFNEFRNIFYKNGKKHIPLEYLEEYYTPLAMAIHYMDDGSYYKHKDGSGHTVSIATCGFARDELEKFSSFLKSKYQISNTVTKSNRIVVRADSISQFISLISPYICSSMLYKIDVS